MGSARHVIYILENQVVKRLSSAGWNKRDYYECDRAYKEGRVSMGML